MEFLERGTVNFLKMVMWMSLSNLGRYSLSSSTSLFNNDNNYQCQVQIENCYDLYILFDINTYSHY